VEEWSIVVDRRSLLLAFGGSGSSAPERGPGGAGADQGVRQDAELAGLIDALIITTGLGLLS